MASKPPVEASADQVAGELLRRKRARASLVEYARSVDIPGAPVNADPDNEVFKPVETSMALHHRVMLEAIQRTIERRSGRLMIFAPPGSAKSSYGSVVTPGWCLSKWPGYRMIIASYAAQIAEKQSRKARSLVRDPRHIAIWENKPTLAADQRAVGQWSLTNGSELMAAGIMGGITGNRANGILIDDPVAGRETADSETIRTKTKDEYTDSVDTRLLPGGWVIIIQTRWHEDDLAGGILPEDYRGESGMIKCRDNQTWEVLNIPAKCEHADDPLGREIGEYLWTEWFGPDHWVRFENNPQGTRTWASLCQQRPTAGEGLEFKREWAKWYDPDIAPGLPGGRPLSLTKFGASDWATKKDKGDFTVHLVMGMDPIADLFFLDCWDGQKTTDISAAYWITMLRRWRPVRWANESGPIDQGIGPFLIRGMREGKVYTMMEYIPSIQNKTLRLATLQGRMAAGQVWFPLKRPWAVKLLDQLCNFPAGKYDDMADAAGLAARLIDIVYEARLSSAEAKPSLVPFTAAWLESTEDEFEPKIRYS